MKFTCNACDGEMETKEDFPFFQEDLTCPKCNKKFVTEWEEDYSSGPYAWLVED